MMMGLFGLSNDGVGVSEDVETATTEKNVDEDWGLIMGICDKAGKSQEDAKSYLRAIIKRLFNPDPHVGIKAVTLLDACIKNSGKKFHIEVASREFENDFTKLMSKAHPNVAKKLRESLKKWADNEFKSDAQLSLIPSMLSKLKNNGLDFSSEELPSKKPTPVSKDPNVVESQEEEDQILKAIELSLKESGSPRSTSKSAQSNSLYPSVNVSGSASLSTGSVPPKEPRKVRALYDFEADEDNELTFTAGEIIFVLDDTDSNWWKGSNHRGEGLFPANFVTADLSADPESFLYEKAKKIVQFKEPAEVKVMKDEPEEIEINEQKIDRLLHLLHEADPTNPEKDTEEMLHLENEVNSMGPLIDTELETVDRKHAQLTQLSANLVEALGLYHTLMREQPFPNVGKMGYGYQPPSTPMGYNGTLPPTMHMGHHTMGPPPGMPQPPDRPQFAAHPGMPQPSDRPQFAAHPGMPGQFHPMMPAGQGSIAPSVGQMPPGGRPGQPQMPGQVHQHEQQMAHYPGAGLPNFGPPGMVHQNFPPPGPASQTNIQTAPQQGPHFVTSSTHLTH